MSLPVRPVRGANGHAEITRECPCRVVARSVADEGDRLRRAGDGIAWLDTFEVIEEEAQLTNIRCR